MDQTPATTHFQTAYVEGEPPWVIGEPQPTVVAVADAGGFSDPVLDLGTGAGEHTLLLARRGHRVVGADAAPAAIERARARADDAGVPVELVAVDALDPDALRALGQFATVLDSALFHIFDAADRVRYVDALRGVVAPGGQVVLLALSDEGPGFGPEIGEDTIREAFAVPGWSLETLDRSTYRGKVTHEAQAEGMARPIGDLVDLPAWLARVRRTAQ